MRIYPLYPCIDIQHIIIVLTLFAEIYTFFRLWISCCSQLFFISMETTWISCWCMFIWMIKWTLNIVNSSARISIQRDNNVTSLCENNCPAEWIRQRNLNNRWKSFEWFRPEKTINNLSKQGLGPGRSRTKIKDEEEDSHELFSSRNQIVSVPFFNTLENEH